MTPKRRASDKFARNRLADMPCELIGVAVAYVYAATVLMPNETVVHATLNGLGIAVEWGVLMSIGATLKLVVVLTGAVRWHLWSTLLLGLLWIVMAVVFVVERIYSPVVAIGAIFAVGALWDSYSVFRERWVGSESDDRA